MSKTCGDTARYYRIRGLRNVRRAKVRKLREEIEARKALSTQAADKPTA